MKLNETIKRSTLDVTFSAREIASGTVSFTHPRNGRVVISHSGGDVWTVTTCERPDPSADPYERSHVPRRVPIGDRPGEEDPDRRTRYETKGRHHVSTPHTHFALHDKRRWKRRPKKIDGGGRSQAHQWTICDRSAPVALTYALRELVEVTCPICMAMKDVWLNGLAKKKPITLRRMRKMRPEANAAIAAAISDRALRAAQERVRHAEAQLEAARAALAAL